MTIKLDREGPLFEQLARDLKRSILGGRPLARNLER
jgi:DNA-binding transcriptional regulator YhcF (GntR family)